MRLGRSARDDAQLGTAQFASLLAAARTGDQDAIAAIYSSLHPRLVRYLRFHVRDWADDVGSEVWMSLARALPRFEGDAPAFRALMFTIARRRVVDHHRRVSRQPVTVPLDGAHDAADDERPEDGVLDGLEAQEAVRRLTGQLPREQAEIVLLRVLGGLDVAQVASIIGKTPGAVRVAQHRAIRRMQRTLQRSAVTR